MVLGIEPDADEAAVERAYRRRVKETHPDLGGSLRAFLRVRAAREQIRAGDADTEDPGVVDGSEAEDPEEADPRPAGAQVEYLDYEVLTDHGWGLDDEDLFEKAAAAGLDPADPGHVLGRPGETLLEAAEQCGFAWPYACRGGACANCAVSVEEGDLSLPVDHVLPAGMVERDIRLSCVGAPTVDGTRVVFNVKHLPALDDLRLPPTPFEQAHGAD